MMPVRVPPDCTGDPAAPDDRLATFTAPTGGAPVPVVLRAAAESEIRWVQATWWASLRDDVAPKIGDRRPEIVLVGHADMRRDELARAHRHLVDDLIAASTVTVASMRDIPEEPIGWSVHQGSVLHYVYVVGCARRCGVAAVLVRAAGCSEWSHMTRLGRNLEKYLAQT